MSHVRISQNYQYSPLPPDGGGDVIVGLEPLETLRVLGQYGNPETDVITNLRPIYPIDVLSGEAEYPTPDRIKELITQLSHKSWFVNASDIALELRAAILTNIVMVGALVATKLTPLPIELFKKELMESMSGERLEMNLKAFSKGFNALKQQVNST